MPLPLRLPLPLTLTLPQGQRASITRACGDGSLVIGPRLASLDPASLDPASLAPASSPARTPADGASPRGGSRAHARARPCRPRAEPRSEGRGASEPPSLEVCPGPRHREPATAAAAATRVGRDRRKGDGEVVLARAACDAVSLSCGERNASIM